MNHASYLDRVAHQVRLTQMEAQRQRRLSTISGQRAVRFGADPGEISKRLPSPTPIAEALTPEILAHTTRAFSRGALPTTAVQEGIQAVAYARSGSDIDAQRAAMSPSSVVGFDAGVALAHGAAKSRGFTPRGMTSGQKAGWLMTFGVEGAGSDVVAPVLATATKASQAMAQGAQSAIASIQKGQSAFNVASGLSDASIGALVASAPVALYGALGLTGVVKMTLGSFLVASPLMYAGMIGFGCLVGDPYANALVTAAKEKFASATGSTS